jgi:hypothetical protein
MAPFDEAQGEEEWSCVDDIQGAGLTAQHQLISIGETSYILRSLSGESAEVTDFHVSLQ